MLLIPIVLNNRSSSTHLDKTGTCLCENLGVRSKIGPSNEKNCKTKKSGSLLAHCTFTLLFPGCWNINRWYVYSKLGVSTVQYLPSPSLSAQSVDARGAAVVKQKRRWKHIFCKWCKWRCKEFGLNFFSGLQSSFHSQQWMRFRKPVHQALVEDEDISRVQQRFDCPSLLSKPFVQVQNLFWCN